MGGVLTGAILAVCFGLLARADDGPRTHRVVLQNFAFTPAEITVRPGDTVEWVNSDIVPHTATESNGDWDTENLAKGQSTQLVFSDLGTTQYICAYHPNMRGKITVTAE